MVRKREIHLRKMDLKTLKWQMIHGSLIRRLILKAFLFASGMLVVSYINIGQEAQSIEPLMSNIDECPMNFGLNTYMNFTGLIKAISVFTFPLFGGYVIPCEESKNLSKNVFQELVKKALLETNAKALCVGEGSASAVSALRELGISDALSVNRHPFFSLLRRRFVYELGFEDNSFDFVFSRALERVSVPALLVHEIERILCPGGIGAMLVGSRNFYLGSLIRSAAPVSLFLRGSDIVHICGVGSFSLVIFKKRCGNVASFEHFRLPNDCPSISNNKPYMKYSEPLVNRKLGPLERELSYLPNYMNISSRDRLIYISLGGGDFANFNIPKLVKLYYPIQRQAFNLFIVDHNISVISSHVKNPGTTFVYHPGLAGNNAASDFNSDEYSSAPPYEGDFDFVSWLHETVEDGDFVVLRMNARAVELNILLELFKTGAICRVDELILRCADPVYCQGQSCGDCMSIFKSLRRSGLSVRQWMGD